MPRDHKPHDKSNFTKYNIKQPAANRNGFTQQRTRPEVFPKTPPIFATPQITLPTTIALLLALNRCWYYRAIVDRLDRSIVTPTLELAAWNLAATNRTNRLLPPPPGTKTKLCFLCVIPGHSLTTHGLRSWSGWVDLVGYVRYTQHREESDYEPTNDVKWANRTRISWICSLTAQTCLGTIGDEERRVQFAWLDENMWKRCDCATDDCALLTKERC